MLIGVLFNEKIFYDKKGGFQTPEIPLIYTHLSSSTDNNSGLVEMIGIEPMSERDYNDFLPLELLDYSSGKLSQTTGIHYFLAILLLLFTQEMSEDTTC